MWICHQSGAEWCEFNVCVQMKVFVRYCQLMNQHKAWLTEHKDHLHWVSTCWNSDCTRIRNSWRKYHGSVSPWITADAKMLNPKLRHVTAENGTVDVRCEAFTVAYQHSLGIFINSVIQKCCEQLDVIVFSKKYSCRYYVWAICLI